MTTIRNLPTLTTITNNTQVLVIAEDQQVNPPITKKVTLTTLFAEAINGIVGAQGVHGSQGLQGPSGPNSGIQGFQGLQGSQGLQGYRGLQGLQGLQGPQGMQGLQGYRGVQGIQGRQGVQGPAGSVQGIQGLQGPSGVSSALTYLNITAFGGVGDGITDNTLALDSALASLSNTGGVIYFPPGKYKFFGSVTYPFPASQPWSVRLLGAGADVTILQWGATNGITFNASSPYHTIHIADLAFSTTAANSGSALTLNNSYQLGAIEQSDIIRCTFRGDTGGGTSEYWTNCISVNGLSNINFYGCLFFGGSGGGFNGLGNGIVLSGVSSGSNKYGIVYNINSCGFFWLANGLVYGTYIQGIQIDQCNFTNGITGIYAGPGEIGLDQLTVSNSQFNTFGDQMWFKTAIGAITLSNNLIYVWENSAGLLAEAEAGVVVTGNSFINAGNQNTGQQGVVLNSGAAPSTIVGNTFEYMSTGINLQSGAQNVVVQGNSHLGNTNNVIDAGTNNTVGLNGKRITVTGNSGSLPNGETATFNIAGAKSYSLLKLGTNASAWVRLYTSINAQAADSSRVRGTAPLFGSGVIADVVTTASNLTQLITPAVIGFNDDPVISSNIHASVTNLSGIPQSITVTLTLLPLEN